MSTINIRVDKSLAEVLENVRRELATDFKNRYSLGEITVPSTLASQVLAAKHRGQRTMKFKVDKVGPNRGVLKII